MIARCFLIVQVDYIALDLILGVLLESITLSQFESSRLFGVLRQDSSIPNRYTALKPNGVPSVSRKIDRLVTHVEYSSSKADKPVLTS